MSLKFKITDKCWQDAKDEPVGDIDFFLEKDGWNFLIMYLYYDEMVTKRKSPILVSKPMEQVYRRFRQRFFT